MAYTITSPGLIGYQPIASTDTVQNHPFGTRIRAKDPTYGEGEFIYLKGVASTVVGSVVTYVQDTGVTALSPNTANLGGPLAVAMSANVLATTFGWYQIAGAAVIKKTAVKVDPAGATWPKVYQSATVGRIMQTSAAGKEILGARFTTTVTVTSTTSTAVVQIERPTNQGAIT